ncbi:MAG: Asp23/Gls24 family envelope stress response protein [Eubacteriales bacterium]|nr:Asp23/Gls24 family envelope stress response protein [Eubacteriales bacterium]
MNSVQIADDVILSIIGVSATKVKGVKALNGGLTDSIITSIGAQALKRGIKIEIKDNTIEVFLSIILESGYNAMQISTEVQDRVKESIESMLDFTVKAVNIKIVDIDLDENY